MPTVMLMHWPEVSREQYERARREVDWEGDVPRGAKFHGETDRPQHSHEPGRDPRTDGGRPEAGTSDEDSS